MRLLMLLCLLEAVRGEVVRARSGAYRGRRVSTRENNTYYSFRGIKYASALRFQPPEPVADSQDELPAEEFGDACLQPEAPDKSFKETSPRSEDCLNLNVYTPDINGSLPVMVFIHGGGFFYGSSTFFDPEYFMDSRRVVYVTLQYRLGVLGFLDFNSEKHPANLGFKDMVAALTWLQRNVAYFGGDPSRVTVEGESSGGVAVNLLLLSPLAKGLVRGGISQSGTACQLYVTVTRQRSREVLRQVLGRTSCPVSSVPLDPRLPADQAAECLLGLSPQELADTLRNQSFLDPQPFGLILEDPNHKSAFLTQYPWEIQSNIPWISGVNSQEVQLQTIPIVSKPILEIFNRGELVDFIPKFPVMAFESSSKEPRAVAERILEHYSGGKNLTEENVLDILSEAISDGGENFPNFQCLSSYNYSKTWNYNFGYVPSLLNVTEVPHMGEMFFLFPLNLQLREKGSDQDKAVSNQFMNLLVSFAETLNPNPGLEKGEWKEFDPEGNLVLYARSRPGGEYFLMAEDPHSGGIRFWQGLPLRDALPPSCAASSHHSADHEDLK